MNESVSKRRGQISELTHLVPIRRGLVPAREWGDKTARELDLAPIARSTYAVRLGTILQAFDDRESSGFPSVIRLFRQIHAAKWVILDGGTRLLLSVVFDGDWGDYMRALARDVPAMLHLIWSNTVGWDPDFLSRERDRRAKHLMDFIAAYQLEVSFLYAHHPQLTVRDIDELLAAGQPRTEHDIELAMGSTARRQRLLLEAYARDHSLDQAQSRFRALLAPRYDTNAFRSAYRETFGEEAAPTMGATG